MPRPGSCRRRSRASPSGALCWRRHTSRTEPLRPGRPDAADYKRRGRRSAARVPTAPCHQRARLLGPISPPPSRPLASQAHYGQRAQSAPAVVAARAASPHGGVATYAAGELLAMGVIGGAPPSLRVTSIPGDAPKAAEEEGGAGFVGLVGCSCSRRLREPASPGRWRKRADTGGSAPSPPGHLPHSLSASPKEKTRQAGSGQRSPTRVPARSVRVIRAVDAEQSIAAPRTRGVMTASCWFRRSTERTRMSVEKLRPSVDGIRSS